MKQQNLFTDTNLSNHLETKQDAHSVVGYGTAIAKTFGEFKTIKGIERAPLWGNYFTTGDLIEIAGQHGVGKTYWLYKLIFALATGGEFFQQWVPTPKKVLLLDGELPIDDINNRFKQITAFESNESQNSLDENFSIINREFSGGIMQNICTITPEDPLFKLMLQYDVVVIDSLKTNSFGSNISNADDVANLITTFLKLKALGITVIYVNHLTKSQSVLGSVDFDIVNDVTISLAFADKSLGETRKLSILKGRALSEKEKQPLHYKFEPLESGIPFYIS